MKDSHGFEHAAPPQYQLISNAEYMRLHRDADDLNALDVIWERIFGQTAREQLREMEDSGGGLEGFLAFLAGPTRPRLAPVRPTPAEHLPPRGRG